jgi:gliding motility-associated-like protein
LGGNPTAGGTWTNPAGQAVSATFTPGTSAPGIYTYTVNAVAPCQTAVATVNVSVNPQPNAGTNAATTVCSSGSAVALFPLLGASAQAGGTWSGPGGGASSGTFTPGSSTDGAYTYTITGIAPCTNASATVTVTTVSAPNAGTGGSLNLCTSGAATALLPALGGAPQAGGTWTGPNGAAMNGILNPSTAASGTYTYTVAGSAPCPSASASVTVSIATAPNAGNNGTANLCSSQSTAYALISGLNGNPSAGGSWTGPNAAPHGPDFLVGNDAPGTYTYTVSGAAPCPSASSTLQVNVTQAANAGIGGQVSLCVNGAPVSPSSWLAGNPDAGGTWSGPGGSINGTVDPANAVSGTYTYALPANGPCPAAAAAVQLVIDPLPNAGNDAALVMCVNGPAMNLFNALGNQAQSGGSWQGPSGPASAQFNPGTSTQGIYTYTVIGSGACTGTSDQATISISVNALPIPVFEAIPAAGCVPLQVQFINSNAASTQSAQWQFGDGEAVSAAAGTWHTYQTDGRFDVSLTVTDANGCTSTLTVNHAVHASAGPAPDFNALPRRVPITGPVTNVTHEPAAGATYTWRVDGEPVDTSGSFQWTFPQEVGIHTICLTATDALGCSNEACIAISVEDELTIYVPNAFTPNNDGKNEVFKPSIIGVERDWYEFIVFDRWGRQVFRTTNPDEGWNGGFNNGGEVLPDGVYLWGLRAKDQWTPAKRDILGSVTLLK